MAMPVLDLSYLTAVARIKIVNESRKSDHDLRHWFALDSAAPTYTHTFSKGSDGRSSEPIIEVVEITDDDT
ncbi:hypothetical protein DV738_g2505, partial [Chaetothyriales sp. CBS 135597]